LFFSVIISAYNRADLLPETISSVLVQTFTDFELIIVDDGSTDQTKAVVGAIQKNDHRVHYYHKENEERGAARNFGITKSNGEFLVFLDSDDLMRPSYLSTLHQTIQENPDIDFLAARFSFIDQNNYIKPHQTALKPGKNEITAFLRGNYLACNFCIRKDKPNFQFFPADRKYATIDDYMFILANLQFGTSLYFLDEVGVLMRLHDSRSMGNNQKVIAAREAAVNWIKENVILTDVQQSAFIAWSAYYCAIHYYLDYQRSAVFKKLVSAIRLIGLKKEFLILWIKAILGRHFILLLK
jgi:GalNAc5-diNAcBac-PP-undecaprenol beta-1,3-glucosyltransferase